MTDALPIRTLVLYKHGVATVSRRGKADGKEIILRFGAGELDDALKSLTAWTLDGGQVSGIHYATPVSADGQNASIPLRLGDADAFFGLLRSLRGIPVTLRLEGSKSIEGRVVGVEEHPQGRKYGAMVILMTDAGSIQQIATDRIVQVHLDDERSARDLSRYLDAATAGGEPRAVRIALTEADREVQLSYTIPSPVWRVSYRLVGDSNDSTCLIQGWAIFDNRFDEDLQDVEVSLVAGQPVSFRYDLTSSVIPARRFVQDEARIAAGPVEFEAPHVVAASAAPAYDMPAFQTRQSRPAALLRAQMEDLSDSTLMGTETTDLAELFEYRVGSVSVSRGESAMVLVVQHKGEYRRELLYNGDKHPGHPVVSMRLRNESGLTLERGPATLLEDGQYRGEAILPFTREGADLVLAYAVELGITVTERTEMTTHVFAIDLKGALLHVQEHLVRETFYTLANDTDEEQVVTVERARWGEEVGPREPDEQTAEHRRWRVTCAAHVDTTFAVTERMLQSRRQRIEDGSMSALAEYLEESALEAGTRQALTEILRLRQAIARIDELPQELRQEQQALAERQERLRRNLTIQPASEEEAEIRRRSSEGFRQTQDREDEIVAALERLKEERTQAEAEMYAVLGQV